MKGMRQRKAQEYGKLPQSVVDVDFKSDKPKSRCPKVLLVITGILALMTVIIILIPSPIEPIAYELPDPPVWDGPMTPNNILTEADRIYENKIDGPESIVVDSGHIYTGTYDGKVLDIYQGEINILAQFGQPPCGDFEHEHTCGRPLGMRLNPQGFLIVVDAYFGLYQINVATRDVTLLWPASAPINGRPSVFLNDIAVANDGFIYMTDSSSRWSRRHAVYSLMEGDDTGRLIRYDTITNTTKELASGFRFINGVQLSPQQDYLLFTELLLARVWKYHLKGVKQGTYEIFADNLPGFPDNIRPSSRAGYWVGFAVVREHGKFSFIDSLANKPWLRSIITKIVPEWVTPALTKKYGLVVELDKNGQIVRSLHDPTGTKIPAVSEVEDNDDVLYLGSFNLPYLSRVYLKRYKS